MTPEHLPVFVYGTLRPGGSNHGWFRGVPLSVEPATFPAAVLVDNGSYPYLLDSAEVLAGLSVQDDSAVVGELVRVSASDWASVAGSLDSLEGTDSSAPVSDGNLYNRYVRTVMAEGGPVDAWVYIPPESHQPGLAAQYPVVAGGNWLKSRDF